MASIATPSTSVETPLAETSQAPVTENQSEDQAELQAAMKAMQAALGKRAGAQMDVFNKLMETMVG